MNEVDMGVMGGVRTIHVYDEDGILVAIFERIEEQ